MIALNDFGIEPEKAVVVKTPMPRTKVQRCVKLETSTGNFIKIKKNLWHLHTIINSTQLNSPLQIIITQNHNHSKTFSELNYSNT